MVVDCAHDSMVATDKLVPNPRNPNRHPKGQIDLLAKIISAQGFRNPIVVSNRSGFITKGHARLLAAQKLDLAQVPVDYQDYENEAAEWADMIADNRLAELAEPSLPDLKDILQELDTGDFDMDLTGFDEKALEELMTQTFQPKAGLTDDDDIPEPKDTICKTGDLWILGKHRLLCGDSTKPEDVARLMGGEKAVLMATDPPYGDSWVSKARDMHEHGYVHSRAVLHGAIDGDETSVDDLRELLSGFLLAAKPILQPPCPFYVWHRAKRMLYETTLLEAGYFVHQPVIWVKPSFVIGRLHYHPRCEWALHGWIQGEGVCSFYGQRNQSDVWELARENDGLHPTQKPAELFCIPLRNHTRQGQIAYEPFAGSGTQFIACEKLGRRCYGMEIEPHYCDVIIERWQQYTGQKAVRL